MSILSGKKILLIISGGIAAYKSLDLIRRIRERDASVQVILTNSAIQFITPLSVATLSGEPVLGDLFDLTRESEIGHIELSRSADIILVAPATANLIAKMAHGLADDLATTTLLATDTPVIVAPAMNVRMWEHPATQRNLSTLKSDGIELVGPDKGTMACNEYGMGRLSEPLEMIAALEKHFEARKSSGVLDGKHVLITAGPTHEPIDPVRYLANKSSGKQGYALARAARDAGARVTLITGPVALDEPENIETVRVTTAEEMLQATLHALPADIAIFAAAVADWRVANSSDDKIKKQANGKVPVMEFIENPDIAKTVGHHKNRPALVIGFAAETRDLKSSARLKLQKKGADLIVANDVSPSTGIMGGDHNRVSLVTANGIEDWDQMDKTRVASLLIARFADMLESKNA